MEIVILAIISGLGIGYFATLNTFPISLNFGPYVLSNIPAYLVVVGGILVGLLLAWIFSLINTFSSRMKLHGKENKIKEDERMIADLTRQNHQLELENTRLKGKTGEDEIDEKSL